MVLGAVLFVFLAAGGAGLSSPPAQSPRNTDGPSFEVASVRLNTSRERPRVRVNAVPQAGRLAVTAMTVKDVILAAYGLQSYELQDNDSPILNQQIDIVARAEGAASMLAADLAPSMRRPVLARTGLTGRYDLDLTYTPEAFTAAALARRGTTAPGGVDPDGPSIYTALQEQLGMWLQSQRTAVDVLVIDSIRPLSD